MRRILFSSILTVFVLYTLPAAGETSGEDNGVAGELFKTAVPAGNYYFAKRALTVFGARWRPEPKTEEAVEDYIWEDLLLSFEAFRRNIEVSQQELDDEITKTLKSEKADFDWKEDKDAYQKWLKERLNEDSGLFTNQLRHLIQIQKLRQQVMDSLTPQASEEEAFQEFLNEYNTLELELAQFDNLKEAEAFYDNLKTDPNFWEGQIKENPALFRRPGFVALEFLMNMWEFPKEDLYKMLSMEIGAVCPPVRIYGGKYGAAKISKVRRADESEFPKLRQSYYEQIKMKKRYEGFNEWLKGFKEEADIKRYIR